MSRGNRRPHDGRFSLFLLVFSLPVITLGVPDPGAVDVVPPRPEERRVVRVESTRNPFIISIGPGSFAIGREGPGRHFPPDVVLLPRLEIDRFEASVGEFRTCVNGGGCEVPPDDDDGGWSTPYCNWRGDDPDLPMNCINFAEAERFCRWRGGRLPSESEWEAIARAASHLPKCEPKPGKQQVPVSGWTPRNCSRARFPSLQWENNVGDMIGNLWEWVRGENRVTWSTREGRYVPTTGSVDKKYGVARVLRGGNITGQGGGIDLRRVGGERVREEDHGVRCLYERP